MAACSAVRAVTELTLDVQLLQRAALLAQVCLPAVSIKTVLNQEDQNKQAT